MSSNGLGPAVESIFHEAERVAVSRVFGNDGNLTGYYLSADDWRQFRAHIIAQVTTAALAPPARPETEEASHD